MNHAVRGMATTKADRHSIGGNTWLSNPDGAPGIEAAPPATDAEEEAKSIRPVSPNESVTEDKIPEGGYGW